MRALVTGAAGFIGSHLCERLLDDGHEVVAVDRMTDYYDVRLKERNAALLMRRPHVTFLRDDAGGDAVISRLRDVDTVFHLAAQPGVRRSWEGFSLYLHENVDCVHRILNAAARLDKRPQFVLASSSSVYGEAARYPCSEESPLAPISPYGVSKLSMEHLAYAYVASFGLNVVNLRYFTVYGPRQRPDMAFHRFIEAALSDEPVPVFGSGGQVRQFTYVDDVVEATVRAGDCGLPPGTTINICGGEPVAVSQVITALSELLGKTIRVQSRPPASGDVWRTGGTSQRARSLLRWHPTTTLDRGLGRQLEWHLAHSRNQMSQVGHAR
jgi:UDP-glucuronate 4-epimerase